MDNFSSSIEIEDDQEAWSVASEDMRRPLPHDIDEVKDEVSEEPHDPCSPFEPSSPGPETDNHCPQGSRDVPADLSTLQNAIQGAVLSTVL